MRIRELGRMLALLVALTLGTPAGAITAGAQQVAKVPRIGVLAAGAPVTSSHAQAAFEQGLRDYGYVVGQNIVGERRYGEARAERISELAAELVRLKVDVIVTSTDATIAAVKQQTRTIPIVMVNASDPVGTGFVASLARPGGNVTGISAISPELSAKRLEFLKEAVPALSRVPIMWNADIRGAVLDYKETEAAARSLRLQLHSVEVSHVDDIDRAFSVLAQSRAEALVVPPINPVLFANRSQVAALAQKHRLPAMYGQREFADASGLMAYGPNIADAWRRAAAYVDKIIKGAKPGELPVEQPTKFELVINLQTAKALGLTLPSSLLRRADHLIQ